jgi:hypothetical protein
MQLRSKSYGRFSRKAKVRFSFIEEWANTGSGRGAAVMLNRYATGHAGKQDHSE